MNLDIPFSVNIILFMAVMTRLGGFLMVAPVYGSPRTPVRMRLLAAILIAWLLMPVLPADWAAHVPRDLSVVSLSLLLGSELFLGLSVGILIRALQESILIGGTLIDRDLGYAFARVFDPSRGQSLTLMSNLLMQLFVFTFLVFNLHLDWLRLAAYSFQTVPLGTFTPTMGLFSGILTLTSEMWGLAFKIALPIFTIILFLNISVGLISKFGQEFEVMMLSFPLRFSVGLLVLAGAMPAFVYVCRLLGDRMLLWAGRLVGL